MKHVLLVLTVAVLGTASTGAQWLRIPTPGIPRTPDGKPNLEAPAPRTPDGRPVLGGLGKTVPARLIVDVTAGLPRGEKLPYQPWAEAVYKERLSNLGKDDPTSNCIVGGVPRSDFVPYPFKILEMPGMVVILYEAIHSYRQIFTDGRSLPKDPSPAWFGYSVGRWERDAFVVESAGFNDNVWLDNNGNPATERLRVRERFVRKDFGHMDIEITVDDAKAYTRPWTVTQPLVYQADDELIEYICDENNRYFLLVPDAAPPGRPQPRPK